VVDGCGLTSLESGFNHAVFVIRPRLASIHVTEVHFHSRDLTIEMVERVLHHLFEIGRAAFAPVNVFVRADLDMHFRSFVIQPCIKPAMAWQN